MSDNQIVVVIEPASVEALKSLYEMYPKEFDWDFSIAGQVKSKDERLEVQNGDLIGLVLDNSHISDISPFLSVLQDGLLRRQGSSQ